MTPHKIARYGWIKDRPDQRDRIFHTVPTGDSLPTQVDMRGQCPPIVDQGQLGSCTANAIGSALQFEQMKQSLPNFQPSRLFIYYNERKLENTIDSDSGAQIRDGMSVVATLGAPPETDWPYDITKFTVAPPQASYTDALKDRVMQYLSIPQDVQQMRGCLAAGFPFVLGFSVYESFEGERVALTGIVPMPASGEAVLGGHAVMAVGYDDSAQTFLVRNSWGSSWGMAGYFTMPYAYLSEANLASDFWSVRLLSA